MTEDRKQEKAKRPRLPGGPLPKVAGLSSIMSPTLAKHPEIVKYLRRTAKELEAFYSANGGREITAPRKVLIDRLLSQLAICRIFEAFLAHAGFLRRDKAGDGVLEPHGLVASWQSLNNQVNRTLGLLGLDELPVGEAPLLAQIVAEYEEKAEAEKGADPAPEAGGGEEAEGGTE